MEQARKRLIFDEFFQFILAAGMQKGQMEEIENRFSFPPLARPAGAQEPRDEARDPQEDGGGQALWADGRSARTCGGRT